MPETNPLAAIVPFNYGDQQVRTVTRDDEPWFVAADVCAVLGIGKVTDAVGRLDEADTGLTGIRSGGQNRQMSIVNESGLYDLIFRSDKPEAKPFRRWVTSEVLPSIRRTGGYVAPAQRGEMLPDISTPEGVSVMADMFAATARQLVAANQTIAEIAPAAESWETLASGTGDYSVADAAKILSRDPRIKLGQQRLFTHLMDLHWLYRQAGDRKWRAYQTAITRGWLSEIPASHYHPRTAELVIDAPQVRVTVKGLQRLHQQFGGESHLALPAPVVEHLF